MNTFSSLSFLLARVLNKLSEFVEDSSKNTKSDFLIIVQKNSWDMTLNFTLNVIYEFKVVIFDRKGLRMLRNDFR